MIPKKQKAVQKKVAPIRPPTETLVGFPQVTKTTLKYHEGVLLDPTAGQFKTYLYKCNGLYDPNYTGTGHQPMGYDQLASVYSHYCVTASRIKLTQLTSPANPTVVGVLVSDQNGSSGPWPAVTEQAKNRVSFVAPTQSSTQKIIVRQKWDLHTMTGIIDGSDSTYSAAVGADPTDVQYFIIFLQALDMSTDIAAQWYLVELEYDVTFTVRKEMTSS